MAFYKGIGGFICQGGFVNGSPLVNGALAATATTTAIDATGTLVGVIAPGDQFTLAGESGSPVHTVTNTTPVSITGNAATGITFTPAIATGGVADDAAVTFSSNTIAQALDWSMSVMIADLSTAALGSAWKTSVPEIASWSGSVSAYLDYNIAQQKNLLNALIAATPTGVAACLFLGVDSSATGAKGYFGAVALKSAAVQVQIGKVTQVKIAFTGNGQLSQNWQ